MADAVIGPDEPLLEIAMLIGPARHKLLCFSQQPGCNVQSAKQNPWFFPALLFDEPLRLEGDGFDFATVNFVSDTQVQLASKAQRLGSSGFLSLRFLAGPEIGRNLQKPDATTSTGAPGSQLAKVDWIGRGKAGFDFTLRFLPEVKESTAASVTTSWAIELNLKAAARKLVTEEVTLIDINRSSSRLRPEGS